MFKKMNEIVKRIVSDHHTVMFTGVMLLLMGFISLSEHLFEKILGIDFEIAYGFIFLGLFNILLAIAFIIMGVMNIEAGISATESPLSLLEKRVKALEDEQKKQNERRE
jgi:hypothetical protein